MKKILLATAILLAILGGLYLMQNYFNQGDIFSFGNKKPTVTIGNQTFQVTIAKNQKDREVGLSQTKSISQNQGMIFLFDKPDHYAFWMKDMKFPIDIIYINNDTIVTIKSNALPPKSGESPAIYTPTEPSNKVLEIQAGLSDKYHFKNGDKVKYENIGN
jgi:uncharacterized protein